MKAKPLSRQLDSCKSENETKLSAVNEQVAKCKQAYANLRAKAESEIKRLQTESKSLSLTVNDPRREVGTLASNCRSGSTASSIGCRDENALGGKLTGVNNRAKLTCFNLEVDIHFELLCQPFR